MFHEDLAVPHRTNNKSRVRTAGTDRQGFEAGCIRKHARIQGGTGVGTTPVREILGTSAPRLFLAERLVCCAPEGAP